MYAKSIKTCCALAIPWRLSRLAWWRKSSDQRLSFASSPCDLIKSFEDSSPRRPERCSRKYAAPSRYGDGESGRRGETESLSFVVCPGSILPCVRFLTLSRGFCHLLPHVPWSPCLPVTALPRLRLSATQCLPLPGERAPGAPRWCGRNPVAGPLAMGSATGRAGYPPVVEPSAR